MDWVIRTVAIVCQFLIFASGYQVMYYDQQVDHFSQISFSGNATFKQRVLINTDYFNSVRCKAQEGAHRGSGTGGADCPIFFYSGNEGPITSFYDASGFVMELAATYKALVVFGEHRYYGESLPFDKDSFTWPNIGLLTVDQALADYAQLLQYLKALYNIPNAPIISFGGSYGGMLSAYLRFKFPNVVTGALAASAPVYLAEGDQYRSSFWSSITQDYENVGPDVSERVRDGFAELDKLAGQGSSGYDQIARDFKICNGIKTESDYVQLQYTIRNAFVEMAMFDYPEASAFGSNLPAWPVNASSTLIRNAGSSIEALYAVTNLVYNDTNNPVDCFDPYTLYIFCADCTGCGLGNDATAWNFQACYEINLAFGSNGESDMFANLPWTDEQRDAYCNKVYPIKSRHDWFATNYWGSHVWTSSNIIWSNGLLDPWHTAGILESSQLDLPAVILDLGAHHLDLRASQPEDPLSVTTARATESFLIGQILNSHQEMMNEM